MEPVNLNALLDSVLTFTGGYAKNKGVDLITEKQDNLPPVMADGEKIKQVMVNLILNGIQAIEKKGEMVIKTYTRGDKVIAEFTDTGPGIPREHLENIFNPFFTTKDTGTGLGLAISYQIMKMHHGAIEVESSEGKGSTFRMILPALIQMEGEKDV
jgi:signal transduction histidine kinase